MPLNPTLFARAAAQPFILSQAELGGNNLPPIWAFYDQLVEQLPLLTLQADSYVASQQQSRPSTHPLGVVARFLEAEDGDAEPPLLGGNLGRRRMELSERRWLSASCFVEDGRIPGDGHLRLVSEVPDEADPEGRISPYEQVGFELCKLVDALVEARTVAGRRSANDALQVFLKALGAKRGRGTPNKMPPHPIVKQLVSEAEAAVAVLMGGQQWEPIQPVRELLAEAGVADGLESSWCLRLALPVMTGVEIKLIEDDLQLGQRLIGRLTDAPADPKRLAVWLTARRLGLGMPSVARVISGAAYSETFLGETP